MSLLKEFKDTVQLRRDLGTVTTRRSELKTTHSPLPHRQKTSRVLLLQTASIRKGLLNYKKATGSIFSTLG